MLVSLTKSSWLTLCCLTSATLRPFDHSYNDSMWSFLHFPGTGSIHCLPCLSFTSDVLHNIPTLIVINHRSPSPFVSKVRKDDLSTPWITLSKLKRHRVEGVDILPRLTESFFRILRWLQNLMYLNDTENNRTPTYSRQTNVQCLCVKLTRIWGVFPSDINKGTSSVPFLFSSRPEPLSTFSLSLCHENS